MGAGNGFEVRGRRIASKLLRGGNEEPRVKDERKGACDVRMILGVTERGGDVIIHKEDVLVGIRNPKIPDPDKVALPCGAVDEVGLVGDGRDVVESRGGRGIMKGSVEDLAIASARALDEANGTG